MLSLIGSLVAMAVVVALALAVLAAVSAVPFVIAVDMAEQRGFSTGRWGAVSLVAAACGAALVALPLKLQTVGSIVWVPAGVLVGWIVVVVLALLGSHQKTLGGPQGAHER